MYFEILCYTNSEKKKKKRFDTLLYFKLLLRAVLKVSFYF